MGVEGRESDGELGIGGLGLGIGETHLLQGFGYDPFVKVCQAVEERGEGVTPECHHVVNRGVVHREPFGQDKSYRFGYLSPSLSWRESTKRVASSESRL